MAKLDNFAEGIQEILNVAQVRLPVVPLRDYAIEVTSSYAAEEVAKTMNASFRQAEIEARAEPEGRKVLIYPDDDLGATLNSLAEVKGEIKLRSELRDYDRNMKDELATEREQARRARADELKNLRKR